MLVVGTTGTGKTSTVNIYTGSNLRVGEGAQAVTGNTIAVEDQIHADAPQWIDNPGRLLVKNNFLGLNEHVKVGLTQKEDLMRKSSKSYCGTCKTTNCTKSRRSCGASCLNLGWMQCSRLRQDL